MFHGGFPVTKKKEATVLFKKGSETLSNTDTQILYHKKCVAYEIPLSNTHAAYGGDFSNT
jgi:hypothetical protein